MTDIANKFHFLNIVKNIVNAALKITSQGRRCESTVLFFQESWIVWLCLYTASQMLSSES